MQRDDDDSTPDPLLHSTYGLRDARGRPVRAPLGNSSKTLIAAVVLLVVGIGVWWWFQPDDLAPQLGGREWAITSVNGEPATNDRGTASAFVFDGNGEVRGPQSCNVAIGEWSYQSERGSLSIEWTDQTLIACREDWPTTYLPHGGNIEVSGDHMTVSTDLNSFEAVSLTDAEPAAVHDLDGSWLLGEQSVLIGPRGLVEIGTCQGEWEAVEPDRDAPDDEPLSITIEFDTVQRDDCTLDPMWWDDTELKPVLHDEVLYLRRDRARFPIDRDIVRLDPVL